MGQKCYENDRERKTKDTKEIKEVLLKNSIPLNQEDKLKIDQQMKKCVCKINTNSSNATGFFGLIEFHDKKMIRALFTCHHNLFPKNSKVMEKSFQYSIGMNDQFISMEIDDSRFVYQNKDFDKIIIEILEKDELYIDNFLEIDDFIYRNEQKYEDLKVLINKKNKKEYYKNIDELKEFNVSTYLLHFPKFFVDFPYESQKVCNFPDLLMGHQKTRVHLNIHVEIDIFYQHQILLLIQLNHIIVHLKGNAINIFSFHCF